MKDTSGLDAKQSVIICAPRETCILKALRQLKGKTFRWAYLGENVSRFIVVERQIGKTGERIEIGGKLQTIAESLRQPYIDYIGKLSVANNSLVWWASSLSEKNPLVSRTFLYACYVKLCQAILGSSREENLVFVAENKTIWQTILANLKNSPGYEIRHIEAPVCEIFSEIRGTLKLAALKVYFLTQTVYHLCLARPYRGKSIKELSHSEGVVLLQNWVDPRSFTPNGEYRDNFFGKLAHHLSHQGKKVVIIPQILLTVSYGQILKKISRQIDSFLLPESFLTVTDVCRLFLQTLFIKPGQKVYPAFAGIDITGLIAQDLTRDRWGAALPSNLLLYEAVGRWKKAGISFETTIYPYENQVWEKSYCLALRKFYPSVKIIGYQHTTVPKMYLNYFFSKGELHILPFPDKVITTGKYTDLLLKKSGYDPAKVICGGAIRYTSLLNKKLVPLKRDITKTIILVTPSSDRNETLELIWKVLKAFGDTKRYKVVLKFHPDCPYSYVAGDIGSLPENFTVSENPSDDLLLESHVLLYSSSTTSIEALALGVPIVHVESDFTIDRDNLADFPTSVRESVSTPDDIVKAAAKILKMDEKELSRKRQLWAEIVAEMFGPVDESTFDLFL